ncbi:MAG: hypothetical protein IT427_01970 [Pirellulales bacterium]|nr:hypothetical protein [Pirellulales bacterium]
MDAVAAYTVSLGRQVLLDKGLQIQASGDFSNPANLDVNVWMTANFTAITGQVYPATLATLPMTQQWSKVAAWESSMYLWDYPDPVFNHMPYINNFVSMQWRDEQVDTMNRFAEINAYYDEWHRRYGNVIVHANFNRYIDVGGTPSGLHVYMEGTHPDMLMFDNYPSYVNFINATPGINDRASVYSFMQGYRTAALAGYTTDAGVNSGPLPYAQYLNLHRWDYTQVLPSESFVRWNQFASWAFGYTFVSGWKYTQDTANYVPVMFNAAGAKTPVFDYVAEANRESRNLGPALVRLISTDIRLIPGKLNGTLLSQPAGVSMWSAGSQSTGSKIDYITSITQRGNLNTSNPNSFSDVLIGYFAPLLPNGGDATTFVNGLTFMIVNGATGSYFSPNGAGDPASASAEWFRIDFDFGVSGFNSLLRLSRDSGLVELINLEHLSGDGGTLYRLDLKLDGGTGDLFRFWNNANPIPDIYLDDVLGDLDRDGDVDGADFVVWQTHFPMAAGATLATGDADGDSDVDGADFVVWQTHYPTIQSQGNVYVPEPTAITLIVIGGSVVMLVTRQSQHAVCSCRPVLPWRHRHAC